MFEPSPLQLYVHIPFCVHKCHYCDFNSHERTQPDWDAYRRALIEELKYWNHSAQFSGRKLHSLFFGGGTPSLAPDELIASVIDTARDCFGMEEHAEITLEANPGTADADRFLAYRRAGVNRLSMGVQSLDSTELQWLERIHGADEAIDAFQIARHAGFNNINLDLMYGLPEQNLHDWLQTLHKAMHLAPEHLSCYQLTVEPHTKLAASHARKPYPLPDDETALSMFFETRRHLCRAGYEAYEISNFCKPGLKCRHNDGYWLYHDYIGIGAGASGKWDSPDGDIIRYSNVRTPERYIETVLSEKKAINTQESLDIQQAAAEAFWLGLRRKEGIHRHAFHQRFDFDAWEQFRPQLQPWKDNSELMVNANTIQLSESGIALADTISVSVL
ncbi:MAG: radical SAM family heme chaperone HemW [Mariprofundus sp.]